MRITSILKGSILALVLLAPAAQAQDLDDFDGTFSVVNTGGHVVEYSAYILFTPANANGGYVGLIASGAPVTGTFLNIGPYRYCVFSNPPYNTVIWTRRAGHKLVFTHFFDDAGNRIHSSNLSVFEN